MQFLLRFAIVLFGRGIQATTQERTTYCRRLRAGFRAEGLDALVALDVCPFTL